MPTLGLASNVSTNYMKTTLRQISIFVLTVLLFGKIYAQDTTTTDYFDQIKMHDLSTVITADSILTEDSEEGQELFKRAEILGFIGENYQRFYIHFISVIQNPTNPYEYFAYGKTKVKETICSFQGKITIRQARIYDNCEIPLYKQGFVICDIILNEDKKQSSTGYIKGILRSDFLIDSKGQLRYDAINFVADGFSNNQFVGSWTSYKTNKIKKCNWGDYRIPECEWINGCDIGAGEFSISDKYLKNGWENYRLAYSIDQDSPESIEARKKENEEWWK
jgi:hypothetical protein